jgi:pyridoxal phosphate enzyme (YggS family)
MTSEIEQNVAALLAEIEHISVNRLIQSTVPALLAASKTRSAEDILAAYQAGVTVFGENRVQEMVEKWPEIKAAHPGVELHFIGRLQSNKAAEVVTHCDLLHTLDRARLADAVNAQAHKQGKVMRCLIQVNTGEEPQKGGVVPREFEALLSHCRGLQNLAIEGLMCVPPSDEPASPHFALLQKMSEEYALSYLSMGMSGDYHEAIRFGASAVRLGTAIFGARS